MKYGDDNYFLDFYAKQNQTDIKEFVFKYFENFISKKDAFALKEQKIEENNKEKGKGLFTTDSYYRISDVCFIKEKNLTNKYLDIIEKFKEINKKYFQTDITNIMNIQYTYYKENQHFNWHPDGCLSYEVIKDDLKVPQNLIFRKLTLALCLSDHTEYEGGEFLLLNPFTTPDKAISSFKMDAGEAIIFPAFLFHKVNPVLSGIRKSIVLWGCGPKWK